MPRAVISYDKDLPEIPDRLAHLPPTSYLRRKPGAPNEFEVVDHRRPSQMLMVEKLRKVVDKWRTDEYRGASEVTKDLFRFWFDEDHIVDDRAFHYYFGQREAIETLIYLVEIARQRDAVDMIRKYGEVHFPEGSQQYMGDLISFQTSMDGARQLRRYVPEVEGESTQDLPAKDLRRYAVKMATGSGKTVVMAMFMVWSYFHKRHVTGSDLSTNFLLIPPNVIVYQRLEKDFANKSVFYELPLVPREWKPEWDQLKVILRGESAEPQASGNLFLANIHQIYESRGAEWTPANAVEALMGPAPAKDPTSRQRPMLERIMSLRDLVILNDEAHHVHDEDLEWHKTLMAIHGRLPTGLSAWLDFSATPKDQNGTYFPWVICDYPLAQAVEDRIVKAPLIVHRVDRKDPENVTAKNVTGKYGDWLIAALERLKEHRKTYKPFGVRPVLFIMAEKNVFATEIGGWLVSHGGLKEHEVLVIHTDIEGEILQGDLEKAREAARSIDKPDNKVKAIVSVMMLREGWDVRSVTVALGLRPFTSQARILPEQAVGRGLRLMLGVSPDRTQTLEVMGTQAFEEFVRQLETEGVGIRTVNKPPAPPQIVEPVAEKSRFDIVIPLTKPIYVRNVKLLAGLDPLKLVPVYERDELPEQFRIRLRMDFAPTRTEVHRTVIVPDGTPLAQDIVASVTNKVTLDARLVGGFAELYPIVSTYLAKRCFGMEVDVESDDIRSRLRDVLVQEAIATYIAREIGQLTAEKRPVEFEREDFRLSETKHFAWRRNLPLRQCKKTVFNFVATYNSFEKKFAQFLDERCRDVIRFASLGTTEQESGTSFRVNYLKPSGALGFYYPDWVAVQKTEKGEVNWIVETKGRIWEGTEAKDRAIAEWCRSVSRQTGEDWRFLRVNQSDYEKQLWPSFAALAESTEQAARGLL